jgi:hypothetical protein
VLRVSEIAPQLPTDIEGLHARLTEARAERDAAIAERDQALLQNDRLRHLHTLIQFVAALTTSCRPGNLDRVQPRPIHPVNTRSEL